MGCIIDFSLKHCYLFYTMCALNPSSVRLEKSPTVYSLLGWGAVQLADSGLDESRLHAELLACEMLKCTRSDLRSDSGRIVDENAVSRYISLINRRKTREPLQYILGSTEFMGLHFVVNRSVFIPRPETELLVQVARDICSSSGVKINRILDIGTGSGNIAVSIAAFCAGVILDAVDSDRDALVVAEKNVGLHHLKERINTILCDISGSCGEIADRQYDMIVSNPPYIPASEYLSLQPEVRDYEPKHACTDAADGLTFYKRITGMCRSLLREGGCLLVEIGYGQSSTVADIYSHAGFRNIKTWKDYAGHDRIVGGERISR